MATFWLLVSKMIPLYLLIGVGFVAGRSMDLQRETFAKVLIYVFAPVVIFSGVATLPLKPSLVALPVVFFVLSSSMALTFYRVAGWFMPSPGRNILAFSAGSANTGYFGIPVALFLFGEQSLGIAVLVIFGFTLFENSLGFYLTARGRHTASEAFRRVVRLPSLYALTLALVVNLGGIPLPLFWKDLAAQFRGAYSLLGMMLIGMGVSAVRRWKLDWTFLSLAFFAKFLIWPLLVSLVLFLDHRWMGLFGPDVRHIMILMACVPLPANSVALATVLQAEPEKASVAVLLSTLLALVFIPCMVLFLL